MKIGFDLDKIFIDHPPFIPDSVIYKLYRKKANGNLLYRYPAKIEQFIRILSHHPLLRPPIKKNISLLNNAPRNKYHSYYLISSRFDFLKKRTEAILKQYKLVDLFDKCYFNYDNKQPHIFKNEVIKKNKIDRHVDDDLPLLRFLAKKNPQIKFFWLNPNNRVEKIHDNLMITPTLSHVFD